MLVNAVMDSYFKKRRFTRASFISVLVYSARAIYIDIDVDNPVEFGYSVNSFEHFDPAVDNNLPDLASGSIVQLNSRDVFAESGNEVAELAVTDLKQKIGMEVNSFSQIFGVNNSSFNLAATTQNSLFNVSFNKAGEYNMDVTMDNALNTVIPDFNSDKNLKMSDADAEGRLHNDNPVDLEARSYPGTNYELVLFGFFAAIGLFMVRRFS